MGVPLNPAVDFVAGTIAGITSLLIGFPLDTVKVRFQSPAVAGKYRSILHAIATILREERFFGLYKGIITSLLTVALLNGMVFTSYRLFLNLQLEDINSIPTIIQITLAGAGSGVVCSILTTPVELIKIREQALLTRTSTRKVALYIFRQGGIPALYRGLTATALRDCGYGAYFATYEATCRYFTPPRQSPGFTIASQVDAEIPKLPWSALLLAGGLAGIVGWVATFPFDVVKTRIQGSQAIYSSAAGMTESVLPYSALPLLDLHDPEVEEVKGVQDLNPFRTTWSTIVYSYKTEGIGVFFRGLSPTLIRAVPVNMVTFATFEVVVYVLS